MHENVVADSSFYICYECDLKKSKWLHYFLKSYSFNLGVRIINELPETLSKSEHFYSYVKVHNEDFFEIVKPFYGRSEKHKNDGEYEAIGIAYHLNSFNDLKNFILDDYRANNFVKKHFPELTPKLIRTIGFIVKSNYDGVLSTEYALEILNDIKTVADQHISISYDKRPCGIDKISYSKILIPTINVLTIKHEQQ